MRKRVFDSLTWRDGYWNYNCEHRRRNADDSKHRYDTELMMQLDPYCDAEMTLPCPQPINDRERDSHDL